MEIKRTCPLCGTETTKPLPLTSEQVLLWQRGELIHKVMPNLNEDDREFIISGICSSECWDSMWPEEDEA